MKVPYGEGLANHIGPESCVYARKGIGEALTGEVRAGLLSRERRIKLRGADAVYESGRQHWARRYSEMWSNPAWSKTPCTYLSSSGGNREVPRLASGDGIEVRAVNPKGERQQ
jgi:hypothetical protein